ncbi:hypothetical protein SASPL_148324 [Salvia splendens]|uniref:Uncharacterized protein n=1 Tax=Salvia splendens TaxID=180675 RepID=A0A8X8WAL0_SALSN|nr:hypothetical protein SASPL_148324 [Salvia splendens]
MASSKSLIRAGASMSTRFLSRAFHTSPNPFLSPKHELIGAAKLLPSLFIPQSQKMAPFYSPPQPQNDVDSLRKLFSEGFLYPCGLPSLPFLLPEASASHSVSNGAVSVECPKTKTVGSEKETNLHQVSLCFVTQRGRTNQVTSDAKGFMDSSLGNPPRVAGESFPDELQRVGIESQHDQTSGKFLDDLIKEHRHFEGKNLIGARQL